MSVRPLGITGQMKVNCILKNKIQLDATYHFIMFVRLNMFRAPLCPSSGAHDDSAWLPHRPSGSRVAAGWKVAGWMSVRTLIHPVCT